MAERRVSVRFTAEIQGFKKAMDEAAQATQKTKKASEDAGKAADTHLGRMVQSATKNSEAWERSGLAVAGAGAFMSAGVGLAVKSFADFDKQMSSVDAATHESAANMTLLREAAVKAGADTAFSAVEAAQGIEELAKAGVSTKDILAGGLDGSLSLAAAGSLGVGEAAEIAASALTQFKLSGDKVPHVADLLAAGAGKAQGSVQDLGAALNQSGLVAASTGLTIEETTGALAAFASAGLTGSDAGTSFKTMLMSLNPNSEAAASLMNELGISAYDAQGKFVGMSEYAGILQNALKGMSDEQRNATLKTLFGTDAVRAANVMYEQGADGINKWEAAVNDAGYAADTAGRMQNNLAGDIEKLGGSIDSVFLKSGSGANDFLRGLAQGAEDVVDWVGQIPGPVLGAAAGITGLVGVAALGAGAFLTLTPRILETKLALDALAPAGSRAHAAMSRLGRVAAGAATGIAAVGAASIAAQPALNDLYKPTGDTADALNRFSGEAARGAIGADTLGKSFDDLILKEDGVKSFQTAVDKIADPGLWGNIDNIAVQGIGILSLGMIKAESTSERARDRFKQMGEALAGLDAEKAAKSFQSMAKQTDGSETSLKRLLEYMPAYRKSLEEQAKAAGKSTDDNTLLGIAMGTIEAKAMGASTGMDAVKQAAQGAKPSAEDLAKALEDIGLAADGSVVDIGKFAQALFDAGLRHLSASDSVIAYESAIDAVTESIKTNGSTLDLNTEKGRANQTAFNGLAKAAMATAEAQAAETLASQGSAAAQGVLQSSLQASYDDLIAAAGQFGITGDAADDMARKALGIPKEVPISTWVIDNATAKLDGIKAKADALDGKNSTVTITTVERIQRNYESLINPGAVPNGGPQQVLGQATGGRISDLPGYWFGGRIPYPRPSDMTKDNVLGLVGGGKPIMLQGQEWVINGRSSDKYNSELAAINAGTFPKLKEYSAAQAGYAPAAPVSAGATVSLELNVHGTTAPREVADEAMGMIRFELQKQGVHLGG
ncbi:phage tail tape measure protein [Paenarthrobacter sp. AR 02]|uniref:phage tail tape measure protein n=1 Tax=Paenarthrobacter sp. AR 02 TaxID=2899821 RepID=UPI001F36FAB1|nr:phage tail tape measure protein [Paenarthrobacter sp. AR 02]MCF3137658.1 phage tail tape measure protein [Paenarthrobacter sp. AR 02]